jgi:hypothetical protein
LVAADLVRCTNCRAEYPVVGGIPWLFPDPASALADWRNRLTLYLEEFAAAERAVNLDLASGQRPSTKARLERLRAAYRTQSNQVQRLLAPLMLSPLPMPHSTLTAVGASVPLSQDLHSYYHNLHRDWSWGDTENLAAVRLVGPEVPEDRSPVIVLGAGGCRLAYDLHQGSARPLTVALDINPLLLLTAADILRGEAVELTEFPIAPRTAEDVAITRQLRAPAPARPGLELLFADAWQAPFAPQSFGAVVTPWLIDIVEQDFASIALHVNRLLSPGGRWINFGSLAFPWRRPALRHSPAELEDILRETGFEVTRVQNEVTPYMRSPASRHGRHEEVFQFTAIKRSRGPREAPTRSAPAWLADTSQSVPVSDSLSLAAEASRIQAVLLALIDGQRSIDEIAALVSEQGLMPRDQAMVALRGLLDRVTASDERLKGV